MRKLFNDEAGFVISAELVLVLTIAVLGMVVGLASVRDSINAELVDLSNAFGAIDTSYSVRGSFKESLTGKPHAQVAGFGFRDRGDDCDCKPIEYIDVCGKPDSSNGAPHEGNDL
ncbi:MAG: hypothetical protein FD138_4143 [Planctomycetota bacterium]|nr:MAG: hypothetical protein FD138_4143 [Planctomycetota bacterium]